MDNLLKPSKRSIEYKESLLLMEENMYKVYSDIKKIFGEHSEECKAAYHCWKLITAYEIDALNLLIEEIK